MKVKKFVIECTACDNKYEINPDTEYPGGFVPDSFVCVNCGRQARHVVEMGLIPRKPDVAIDGDGSDIKPETVNPAPYGGPVTEEKLKQAADIALEQKRRYEALKEQTRDQYEGAMQIDPDFQKKIEEADYTDTAVKEIEKAACGSCDKCEAEEDDHNVKMSDGSVQKFSELTPEQTQGMVHGVLIPKGTCKTCKHLYQGRCALSTPKKTTKPDDSCVLYSEDIRIERGTFEWALAMMKQGKKVRVKTWKKGVYVYLLTEAFVNLPDMTVDEISSARIKKRDGGQHKGTVEISVTEMLYTNWELYEE